MRHSKLHGRYRGSLRSWLKNGVLLPVKAILLNEYPNRRIEYIYTEVKPAASRIPNRVYQTWVDNRLGRTHLRQLEAFRNANPDFSFEFFDTARMDSFMETHYGSHPIFEVYNNALFGPLKADIWRYCLLCRDGGWYFDINKCVRVPLRTLATATEEAVIAHENNLLRDHVDWQVPPAVAQRLSHPEMIVLNWGLGFAPGHPFLGTVIENIVRVYPRWKGKPVQDVKDAVVNFTGPIMLTKAVWQVIDRNPAVVFRDHGIDFSLQGTPSMRRSWSRYCSLPSYSTFSSTCIVR